MDDKITCEYVNDCIEEGTLYGMIKHSSIESSLKEELLEKVKELNKTNSYLMQELHNYQIEVKKLNKIILKLVYELYEE